MAIYSATSHLCNRLRVRVTLIAATLSVMGVTPHGGLRAEELRPPPGSSYDAQISYKSVYMKLRAAEAARFNEVAPLSLISRNPEIEQNVRPSPETDIFVGDKAARVGIDRAKVSSCFSAISELKKRTPQEGDRTYADALLTMDKLCLTDSAAQPNVADPAIPKRSLIILTRAGRAFCTGMLLNEQTLATARHCFINQSTGKVLEGFGANDIKNIQLYSLDLQRRVEIAASSIALLSISDGFGIDREPVKIPVKVIAAPGAQPLAQVLFKSPTPLQLLWVAGPVAFLDEALAMERTLSAPQRPASPINWQDSIRWSMSNAAQCRVETVSPSCVYHTCQTSAGYSGSPMISTVYADSAGSNVIEVVGIHSGTPSYSRESGWADCARSTKTFNASSYTAFNVGKNGGF